MSGRVRRWLAGAVLCVGVLCAAVVQFAAADAPGCWSGWGYWVEPESLAFRSDRLLLATDGPVDWAPGRRIELHRLDPETGQRIDGAEPIVVRPQHPRFGHARGNRTVDDVARAVGEPLDLMLGMTRIGPGIVADAAIAWACGKAGRSGG